MRVEVQSPWNLCLRLRVSIRRRDRDFRASLCDDTASQRRLYIPEVKIVNNNQEYRCMLTVLLTKELRERKKFFVNIDSIARVSEHARREVASFSCEWRRQTSLALQLRCRGKTISHPPSQSSPISTSNSVPALESEKSSKSAPRRSPSRQR